MATAPIVDPPSHDLYVLRDQNAALRKQVEQLQAEPDSYRRTLKSWAKSRITEEVIQGWMAEEKAQGTLLEFINEVNEE